MLVRDWMTVPAPRLTHTQRLEMQNIFMLKLSIEHWQLLKMKNFEGIITRRDILKFDPTSRILANSLRATDEAEYKIVGRL
jgi:signal-transduction protein with cAMP-binding, CBS, and nucleotidyltransferase domain